MARILPHQRPLYPPTERMTIPEVNTARRWPLEQTAKAFPVATATIASWMGRVDEQGPDALVQSPESVNKFPHVVRYLVERLKMLCPMPGKVKIAHILGRAGLHLGQTTVGRVLVVSSKDTLLYRTILRGRNRGHRASRRFTPPLHTVCRVTVDPGFLLHFLRTQAECADMPKPASLDTRIVERFVVLFRRLLTT